MISLVTGESLSSFAHLLLFLPSMTITHTPTLLSYITAYIPQSSTDRSSSVRLNRLPFLPSKQSFSPREREGDIDSNMV